MVTGTERDYLWSFYAADPRARINLGIRRRLAPLLENDRRKIELLNSLLFSLPGTPVVYYGDEIGMGDNIYLGDRDGVRTPMQWSLDRNGGFSRADPAKLFLPAIQDPGLWLQRRQCRSAAREPIEPFDLDAADHRGAAFACVLRARHLALSSSVEPESSWSISANSRTSGSSASPMSRGRRKRWSSISPNSRMPCPSS